MDYLDELAYQKFHDLPGFFVCNLAFTENVRSYGRSTKWTLHQYQSSNFIFQVRPVQWQCSSSINPTLAVPKQHHTLSWAPVEFLNVMLQFACIVLHWCLDTERQKTVRSNITICKSAWKDKSRKSGWTNSSAHRVYSCSLNLDNSLSNNQLPHCEFLQCDKLDPS